MKSYNLLGIALVLSSCGVNGTDSTTQSQRQGASSKKQLIELIEKVACVDSVEVAALRGIPEQPVSGESDTLLVAVKDIAQINQCAKDLQKAIPGIKIGAILDFIGTITVDAKESTVGAKPSPAIRTPSTDLATTLRKLDCVESVEAERRVGTPEQPVYKLTGNYFVGVRKTSSLEVCRTKVARALPKFTVRTFSANLGLLFVSPKK